MNLDAFKDVVVNEKDPKKKMEYIFKNFDPKAYSFYKLDYDKEDDEL